VIGFFEQNNGLFEHFRSQLKQKNKDLDFSAMPFGLSYHFDNKHALLTGKNRPASQPDGHMRAATGKTEA